jgi:hypothetical protein
MHNSEQRYIKKVQKLIDYKSERYHPGIISKIKLKMKELKMPHIKEAIFICTLAGGVPIGFSIIYFLCWFSTNWRFADNFIVGVPFFFGVGMCIFAYIRYTRNWKNSCYYEDVQYFKELIEKYNKEKNK